MRNMSCTALWVVLVILALLLFGCTSKPAPTPDTRQNSASAAPKAASEQDGKKAAPAAPKDIVKIPGGASPSDKRYSDVTEALQLALEKTRDTYGDYELVIADAPMTGSRFTEEVKTGKLVNVIWRTYTPELSKELLTIPIDPRKGLMGYRVFLIRKEDQVRFSKVKSLADLKRYKAGQGLDWLDVQVFKSSGLPVVTGSTYGGLFDMLLNKRFDYFSRSISEAYTEYEDRKLAMPDLQVEDSLVLYYPWPYFYYVNPKETRIAERLQKGLEIMVADGSMDRLFEKYNKTVLEKAHIKTRKILRIENPLMKDAPPTIRNQSLWYDPEH